MTRVRKPRSTFKRISSAESYLSILEDCASSLIMISRIAKRDPASEFVKEAYLLFQKIYGEDAHAMVDGVVKAIYGENSPSGEAIKEVEHLLERMSESRKTMDIGKEFIQDLLEWEKGRRKVKSDDT